MPEEPKRKIVARAIVEILGTPKDHVANTIKDYVEKLKKDTSMKVHSADIAEPEEQNEGVFSAFVELELEFDSTKRMLAYCIDSLPSSIDILEPEKLTFESQRLADLLNDILATLHSANKTITLSSSNAKTIDKNAVRVLENFVIYMVNRGVKTGTAMSPFIGLPEQNVNKFLEDMSGKGILKKVGDEYTLG